MKMKKDIDSNSKIKKLSPDSRGKSTGGTGPNDFDMESMQRYMQEREEIARENQNEPLFPHAKRSTGGLFR